MKQKTITLLLAAALLLSGCSSMLDRPYSSVVPHPEHPGGSANASSINVRNYSELVNAILYFVSQAAEEGHLQMVEYDGDAETDLKSACLEVSKDAPLGAYAVESITSDYTRVVANYEVNLHIAYRRTPEQIRSLVSVTGSAAIRRVLSEALSTFQAETAMHVSYFTEDQVYLSDLVRQAYYKNPSSAFGMPDVSVSIYPDAGNQRIVELTFVYRAPQTLLQARRDKLEASASSAVVPVLSQHLSPENTLALLLQQADKRIHYLPPSPGTSTDTPWDALVGRGGDDQGMALALKLLSDMVELDCDVIEGTLNGAPHFWNRITVSAGSVVYVDLSVPGQHVPRTREDMIDSGYIWEDETSGIPSLQ